MNENKYVLIDTDFFEKETCYLNHSTLSTHSAGSFDMAWVADSEEKAEIMRQDASNNSKCTSRYLIETLDNALDHEAKLVHGGYDDEEVETGLSDESFEEEVTEESEGEGIGV